MTPIREDAGDTADSGRAWIVRELFRLRVLGGPTSWGRPPGASRAVDAAVPEARQRAPA